MASIKSYTSIPLLGHCGLFEGELYSMLLLEVRKSCTNSQTWAAKVISLLQPTGYETHQQVQHSTILPCAHNAFSFVFIWEQTATCATYGVNWLVFITEMKSVYSAVRTGSLNKAVWKCTTYRINWLVFITEMKSVYITVRTGSLNKAVCT